MISVLELEPAEDGVFVATLHDIRTTDDIETVDSLDRFSERTARVRVGGEERTITVYERGGLTYARLSDLS